MKTKSIDWRICFGSLLIIFSLVSGTIFAQETQLARTPPMGWNSWGGAECKLATDAYVRSQTDVMVSNGMKAAGYEYMNIDACWQGKRDAQGRIHGNERFPDMKALADYIHSKGLKFGLYSSPGPTTCAGDWPGSLGHEEQDAQTYADWGVDYLKYDYCSFKGDVAAEIAAYKKMGDALKKTGRPIVFALCQYGMDRGWSWGASVGGNLWRTTGDLRNNWESMTGIGFGQNGLERFAGPGHWNDPDMLYPVVSDASGKGVSLAAGGMTIEEYRVQMSLWCLLAAPLIVSADLTKLTPELLALLTNPEVIAVDQDPAGIQGRRVAQEGPLEVWMKPLVDGSKAVGLFNRGVHAASPVTVYFRDIDIGEKASVRDLWAHKDLGVFAGSFTATVPSHGVVMIEVKNSL
jgi:alpha-galactosidase